MGTVGEEEVLAMAPTSRALPAGPLQEGRDAVARFRCPSVAGLGVHRGRPHGVARGLRHSGGNAQDAEAGGNGAHSDCQAATSSVVESLHAFSPSMKASWKKE